MTLLHFCAIMGTNSIFVQPLHREFGAQLEVRLFLDA